MTQAYLEISFAVVLQLFDIHWTSNGLYFNNVCFFLFCGFTLITPIWLIVFLNRNYDKLSEEEMLETYGPCYEGIDLDNNKASIFKPLIFLLRRTFLVVILYFMLNQNEYLKIVPLYVA
jgi:hypothetical protein